MLHYNEIREMYDFQKVKILVAVTRENFHRTDVFLRFCSMGVDREYIEDHNIWGLKFHVIPPENTYRDYYNQVKYMKITGDKIDDHYMELNRLQFPNVDVIVELKTKDDFPTEIEVEFETWSYKNTKKSLKLRKKQLKADIKLINEELLKFKARKQMKLNEYIADNVNELEKWNNK